ncbi:MAG: hypothetical protein U0800_15625 [Isosphaeraceae bacterium]
MDPHPPAAAGRGYLFLGPDRLPGRAAPDRLPIVPPSPGRPPAGSELLHQAAAVSPASADSPSLWPLARQIREEPPPCPGRSPGDAARVGAGTCRPPARALAASALVCIGLGGVAYHATSSPEARTRLVRLVRRPAPVAPVPFRPSSRPNRP